MKIQNGRLPKTSQVQQDIHDLENLEQYTKIFTKSGARHK